MEKRVIHLILAIVTVAVVLTAFSGFGNNNYDTESEGNATANLSSEDIKEECEDMETPMAFTDGNSGTINIPLVGASVMETDVKHHFDMPEGMTKVEVTFTWDPAWELTLDIGLGNCPHSGTLLETYTCSSGTHTLVFEDVEGLETGQWFAHIKVTDVNAHRGESCTYSMSAVCCSCTDACGDCDSDGSTSSGHC
ncbi:MAG: hypothetical protein QCI38_00275 [Candidatus Thermoplasmatota archaeon]|nr:hypothetical protein [Candidatus Thermoplasmatota archaeon]